MDVKRQSIFFALEQGMTGIASDIMWQPRKFHNSVHVYILSVFLWLLGGSRTPGDSSRDLFSSFCWWSRFHPLKGDVFTIPKRSRIEFLNLLPSGKLT